MSGQKVDHLNRKHAMLSASGAERWMNCTPSARLEENFEEETSVFAEEGTLAHEFADLELRFHFGEIPENVYNREIRKRRKNELYTNEMEPQVGKYVDIVKELYATALKENGHAEIYIEQRLDFSHLVEQGFGTGDVTIVTDQKIQTIDLKYGKGIQVEAEENPQLKLYGLGALRANELLYDIQTIELIIVQPRLDHYSSWETSVTDLTNWGEEEVKPKAVKAYAGEGEQVVGDWCRFCKAKAVCRAMAEHNMGLAKHDFKDPLMLSDNEALEVFEQIDALTSWAKSVENFVKKKAVEGKKWPGYKLVEGRSNRRWTDEKAIIKTLRENKFKRADYINSKIAGIGAIEKLVGKAQFYDLLGSYIVKPPGAPTLVAESDKRPALGAEQAKLDFSE